ncbi:hypothetical protein Tco_0172511 [Tanacetum coccineum]
MIIAFKSLTFIPRPNGMIGILPRYLETGQLKGMYSFSRSYFKVWEMARKALQGVLNHSSFHSPFLFASSVLGVVNGLHR